VTKEREFYNFNNIISKIGTHSQIVTPIIGVTIQHVSKVSKNDLRLY